MTGGVFSWQLLAPMVIIQSPLSVFKHVDCKLGYKVQIFMLFCQSGRNGVSSRIIAFSKCIIGSHLVWGKCHSSLPEIIIIQNLGFKIAFNIIRILLKKVCNPVILHQCRWFMKISSVCCTCHAFKTLSKTCWNHASICISRNRGHRGTNWLLIRCI